jgi:WD40 repeat protein
MIEHLFTLSGHDEKVWHASWTKDGKYLATCGEDRSIRIWGPFDESWNGENATPCIATLEDGQSRTLRCVWKFC